MKKRINIFLFAIAIASLFLMGQTGCSTVQTQQGTTGTTQTTQYQSTSASSYGLDFSLISSIVDETQGVQLVWIYAKCNEKMVGVQYSLVCKTAKMTGVQLSFVGLVDEDVTGIQWGFYNSAKKVTGLQLGFINVTEDMQGIQIGLVNHIKNSKLPWMVIANAKF